MGSVSESAGHRAAGPNEALAREVVDLAWRAGVRTFIVCPGGRNAPLVEALDLADPQSAEVLHFFDERSAGFFALGRAKRDRRPVAVVTTSGTAAAELLPAMVEAYYAGERLVAITADRPARFRGTGAPQAIDQRGLFGVHVAYGVDLDQAGTDWALTGAAGPAHVNVCFEEPLLEGWQGAPCSPAASGAAAEQTTGPATPEESDPDQVETVRAFLEAHPRPLVILGALQDSGDQTHVRAFCTAMGAPVLAEASSHLWGGLDALILEGREASAEALIRDGRVGAVLRIGDVPSFRVWRDLEDRVALPVLSVSRRRWPGLTRGHFIQASRGQRLPLPEPASIGRPSWPPDDAREALAGGRERGVRIAELLARFSASEPALVARLSRTIPPGASVYLGNSLPIREWNQFATMEDRGFGIRENRGVNGIDGQVSTFLGAAEPGRENWAIVGDLTALYDLSALWALRYLDGVSVRIVVINNGGGRIFGRMFANPNFQNLHQTGFEGWAALWSVPWSDGASARSGHPAGIIELRPDAAQTAAFWAAWGALRSG